MRAITGPSPASEVAVVVAMVLEIATTVEQRRWRNETVRVFVERERERDGDKLKRLVIEFFIYRLDNFDRLDYS